MNFLDETRVLYAVKLVRSRNVGRMSYQHPLVNRKLTVALRYGFIRWDDSEQKYLLTFKGRILHDLVKKHQKIIESLRKETHEKFKELETTTSLKEFENFAEINTYSRPEDFETPKPTSQLTMSDLRRDCMPSSYTWWTNQK